jgi:3-oxoacyl-[acyl-carrier-protein] synthase III
MNPQPRTRTHLPKRTVSIIGTGSYVPEKILTNAELEKMVDTTDEWITTRTGIKERRIAAKGETTSDMSAKAAQAAIENAGISPEEIDLIILASITPDQFMPSSACLVQTKIGATRAACFDISAACSGFLYAIEIAQQFITSHTYNTILVIGADKLSSIVNWQDRNTWSCYFTTSCTRPWSHRHADGQQWSAFRFTLRSRRWKRLPGHTGKRSRKAEHHSHGRSRNL